LSLLSFFTGKPNEIGEYIDDLIDEAADNEIELRVVSTYRSQREQDQLYAQGRTSPGPIVTWTQTSAHTRGRAVDFTIEGSPEYDDDPEAWETLGRIGTSMGLNWGGSFQDYGHFEL
jgi:D-alanyl-D-alanine dipeptidase